MQARDLYRQVLAAVPNNAQVLAWLGAIEGQSGHLREAVALLARSLELAPDEADTYFQFGQCLVGLGRIGDAFAAYDRTVALEPRHFDAWFSRSMALLDLGRVAEAVASFDQAEAQRRDVPQLFIGRGSAYHALGRYAEALANYDAALALQPNLFEARFNRAGALRDLKRPDDALSVLDHLIASQPDSAPAYGARGNVQQDLGQLDLALADYDRALTINADLPDALYNRGNALLRLNRPEDAVVSYKRFLALSPNFPSGHIGLGNALRAIGRMEEALASYDRALHLNPESVEALTNRGSVLHELERLDDALAAYDRALSVQPQFAAARSNRGNVLYALGQFDAALADYDVALAGFNAALEAQPDYPDTLHNRGIVLQRLSRFEEALAAFDRLLTVKPLFAQGYTDRGIVLMALRRFPEALDAFDQALTLDPTNANALLNRGSVLQVLRRFEDAVQDLDAAEALRADLPWLPGMSMIAHLQLAHWRGFDDSRDAMLAKVVEGKRSAAPLLLHALVDDPELHRRAAEIYAAAEAGGLAAPVLVDTDRRGGPLRIGYVSSDFKNHPVAHLIAAVFEHHDRNRVEVFAFSTWTEAGDVWRERVMSGVDHFIDVSALKDAEVAARMRALDIDVAIDLNGFTEHGRPGIFACRAARVQAAYIGFLGTMAMAGIDYLIADEIIIPQEKRRAYAEKIAYLPSYQANDDRLILPQSASSRAAEGLPDTGFVFCSFNQTYKLMPEMFASWMRILNQVPGSLLWLYVESEAAADNLRGEAERHGIAADRLTFARRVPLEDHLARLPLADLFLDSHPYNAGATASNALRMGLPVLTRIGDSFAARMGASLLTAAGTPELVTDTGESYEALAVALARDPDRLAGLKAKLIAGRETSALFNTAATTRALEDLYAAMLDRSLKGLAPDHICQT